MASLIQRWLLGTHQGAVQPAKLDHYLDEFAFRFNRRKSSSRGMLFYRLLEQAVITTLVTYKQLVAPPKLAKVAYKELSGQPRVNPQWFRCLDSRVEGID